MGRQRGKEKENNKGSGKELKGAKGQQKRAEKKETNGGKFKRQRRK